MSKFCNFYQNHTKNLLVGRRFFGGTNWSKGYFWQILTKSSTYKNLLLHNSFTRPLGRKSINFSLNKCQKYLV